MSLELAEMMQVSPVRRVLKVAFCDFRRKAQRASAAFLYRAERVMDVKRIGVLEECSEAEWSQNDNLLIPLAH